MTRKEYLACVSDLNRALDEAEDSGSESQRLGAVMALDAFLSCVRVPPEDPAEPGRAGTKERP